MPNNAYIDVLKTHQPNQNQWQNENIAINQQSTHK